MRYRSTRQLARDLQSSGQLIEVSIPVDPKLELAEIHRRVYASGGPALLFTNVIGCRFPVATNLWGTLERARWIFRDTFETLQLAIRWKTHPEEIWKSPGKLWRGPIVAMHMLPKRVRSGPVMGNTCQLSELPQVVCWPDDGGPFVTLPQVLSQAPDDQRLSAINLGMYRIQLAGNRYEPNSECGLHYQLHRGIGVHHTRAIELGQPFHVNVSVGGTPAMTIAAVMPLPEGMSELGFAGALASGRIPLICSTQPLTHAPIYADADFVIQGVVDPTQLKPEGPFGDHLGYYAYTHDFPLLKVTKVWHRADAVWPMTVVGRPPQEDTVFGQLIHELTEPVIPTVLPGVKAVHAVDAAGVHPLLLAIGSERYTPYAKPGRPQELLTQASAILGQGQLSLAKYLWITEAADKQLDIHDVAGFLQYVLARVDWTRDLHFHTRTTIDTLDYSGDSLNAGSKLVVAANGEPKRHLPTEFSSDMQLPDTWHNPRVALPGVLCVESAASNVDRSADHKPWQQACNSVTPHSPLNRFPLIVLVDDAPFASRNINNFVWVTFTRSNPAVDVYGIGAQTIDKHFSVSGSLVIDSRIKPHHAPPLIEAPDVTAKVDALASQNLPISRYL